MKTTKPMPSQQLGLILTALLISLGIDLSMCYTLIGNVLTDLTANDPSGFVTDANGWTLSAYVSYPTNTYVCNGNYLMGGYNIMANSLGSYYQRIYSGLPDHNLITFSFDFQTIDSWDGYNGGLNGGNDHFEVAFDTNQYYMWRLNTCVGCGPPSCGAGPYGRSLFQAYLTVPHTGLSLTFKVLNYLDQDSIDESFGFRNIKMVFSTVPTPTYTICGVSPNMPLPDKVCPCTDSNMYMTLPSTGYCLYCNSKCKTCNGGADNQCLSCFDGLYLSSNSCFDCAPSCKTCDGGGNDDCLSCYDGYYLSPSGYCLPCNPKCKTCNGGADNQCLSCFDGLYLSSGSCYDCAFNCATCNGGDKASCLTCPSSYPYMINGHQCVDACSLIDINCITCTGSKCLSCDVGYLLYIGDSKCYPKDSCPSDTYPDGIHCVQPLPEGVKTAQGILSGASSIVASAVTLVNFGSPVPMLVDALAGILLYMKYMSLTYPPRLQYILDLPSSQIISIQYISSAPDELEDKIINYPLADNFERNEVHSSFLINFWSFLINLLLIFLVIVLVCAIERLTRKYRPGSFWLPWCSKLKEALKWNYLLSTFAECYGYIAFYSAFEFQNVWLTSTARLEILSFNVCVAVNIVLVIISVAMALVIKRLSREKNPRNLEKLKQQLNEFQVIFEDFKNESISQQSYFLISCIRFYIFYTVLAYLYEHPLAQAIIINAQSLAFLLYLIFKRPLNSKLDLVESIALELIIEVVHSCVLGFAIIGEMDPAATVKAVVLGDVMIVSICLFIIAQCLYMLIQVIKAIITIVRFFKKIFLKQRRPKTVIRQYTAKPPQSDLTLDRSGIIRKQEDIEAESSLPVKRDVIQPLQRAAFMRRPVNQMFTVDQEGKDRSQTDLKFGKFWNILPENKLENRESSPPIVKLRPLPLSQYKHSFTADHNKKRNIKIDTVPEELKNQ